MANLGAEGSGRRCNIGVKLKRPREERKRIFTPEISGLILLPQAGFVYSTCSFSLAILS
jgi:hypothetical protein